MEHEVEISIICNTYNQDHYISDALQGFVNQKVSVPFEVLVHDDASTDNTAAIIKAYELKYPDLIKPLYQTENQYSRGVNITTTYQIPRAKGKYIALCEGDDYWTDSSKLQKQYDSMENHDNVDICAHQVTKVSSTSGKILDTIAPSNKETIFDVSTVIKGGGGFVSTNSLFLRKSLYDNIPQFYRTANIDYALQIWGALRGGMLYLPDNMGIYRALVKNSWSCRMSNPTFAQKQQEKLVKMLDILDCETNHIYEHEIEIAKLDTEFYCMAMADNYKELRKGKYHDLYASKPISWRLKTYIKQYCPLFVKLCRK